MEILHNLASFYRWAYHAIQAEVSSRADPAKRYELRDLFELLARDETVDHATFDVPDSKSSHADRKYLLHLSTISKLVGPGYIEFLLEVGPGKNKLMRFQDVKKGDIINRLISVKHERQSSIEPGMLIAFSRVASSFLKGQ